LILGGDFNFIENIILDKIGGDKRREASVVQAFKEIKEITCSALALSTVLRTTSLSYGNMPFSGTHPTKTP
jgi:hypothetical protein